jgi:tetratricopeptide (TPR) repeat protein
MTNQTHNGPGDNVAGNKYESIIHSIRTKDLKTVVDDIMRDICYRDFSIAIEKLNTLTNIDSLDDDVKSLLSVIQLKVELAKGSVLSDKKELLGLLRSQSLSVDVRDVVTSILIDFESRSDSSLARTRFDDAKTNSPYVREIFFERIASREEIHEQFESPTKNDLFDQELAGLIRGSLRVEEFKLAVEIGHFLNNNFPSTNSKALLAYSQSCFILTQNQSHHYFMMNKKVKDDVDELVIQLPDSFQIGDPRYIPTLINLLNITYFVDRRLIELGKKYVDKIRDIDDNCADTLQRFTSIASAPPDGFELTSNPLDLDGLMNLHSAIEVGLVQFSSVKSWLDSGGDIQTGDGYINAFAKLQLRTIVCSNDDKKGILSLGVKAKEFIELDKVKFLKLNPFAIITICDKFIELNLSLTAVEYLSYFIPEESWVSPLFECYLNALISCEKYNLFLAKIKHLPSEDKSFMVWIREAQLYERTGEYGLSVKASRSAIQIAPNNPYAWSLLLYASRMDGKTVELLKDIIFEIPDDVFLSYHESKVPLVNEIATYIDLNIADRILVDWFVQDPDVVAYAISQIHHNSLINRPEVTKNPYKPNYCGDGVTYSDGYTTFKYILVTGVESNHSSLLNVESPKGKILQDLKVGDTIDVPIVGEITLIERLPPYVAAYRLAIELRNKSNDGTDAFHLVNMPSNEEEIIPFLEKFLKRFSQGKDPQDLALNNPNIPLVMRSHYTNPNDPINGAFTHLNLESSTQHMGLFNEGVMNPAKVIIDTHTAVYFALIGLVPNLKKMSLEIILSQQTKSSLELWIKDTLREDYLTLHLTEHGIQRRTSEDIKRDSLEFIKELQELVEYSKVETLNKSDTPDEFIKIRGVVNGTVYSTFQLSVANKIPLLCIDHVMCTLFNHSGHPVANIYSMLMELLNTSPLEAKKKGIQLNLFRGTPIPILYRDIVELSRSTDNIDVYCVAKFIEKYGVPNESSEISLDILVDIVGQVTCNAYIGRGMFIVGGCTKPTYDGYAEHVFNSCCRAAIKVVFGKTAEQRLALFLFSLLSKFGAGSNYVLLILRLASNFATGHFLDIEEVNRALEEHIKLDVRSI